MAQTLFLRCTRKLSRSVFIQITHHQLVFYETTHGPLKQSNDIKTTRATLIMNNRLCSLPGLIKMKEMVIWFKKSYSSCLSDLSLMKLGGGLLLALHELCAMCCIDFSKAVVCFTRAVFCIKGLKYYIIQYVIVLSETSCPLIWHMPDFWTSCLYLR